MYVSEQQRIRRISPDGTYFLKFIYFIYYLKFVFILFYFLGQVTTLAGGGTGDEIEDLGDKEGSGREARFRGVMDMCLDAHGDIIVADCVSKKIAKITTK
jgi:hypothetical protein